MNLSLTLDLTFSGHNVVLIGSTRICLDCGRIVESETTDRIHQENWRKIDPDGKKTIGLYLPQTTSYFDDEYKWSRVENKDVLIYRVDRGTVFRRYNTVRRITYNKKTKRLFLIYRSGRKKKKQIRDITYSASKFIRSSPDTNTPDPLLISSRERVDIYNLLKSKHPTKKTVKELLKINVREKYKLTNKHYQLLCQNNEIGAMIGKMVNSGWTSEGINVLTTINALDIYPPKSLVPVTGTEKQKAQVIASWACSGSMQIGLGLLSKANMVGEKFDCKKLKFIPTMIIAGVCNYLDAQAKIGAAHEYQTDDYEAMNERLQIIKGFLCSAGIEYRKTMKLHGYYRIYCGDTRLIVWIGGKDKDLFSSHHSSLLYIMNDHGMLQSVQLADPGSLQTFKKFFTDLVKLGNIKWKQLIV